TPTHTYPLSLHDALPISPPSWQKQESSPSVKMQRDLDRFTGEPEAGPETHIQKLIASLDPAKIQEVAASQAVINDMYYKMALQRSEEHTSELQSRSDLVC